MAKAPATATAAKGASPAPKSPNGSVVLKPRSAPPSPATSKSAAALRATRSAPPSPGIASTTPKDARVFVKVTHMSIPSPRSSLPSRIQGVGNKGFSLNHLFAPAPQADSSPKPTTPWIEGFGNEGFSLGLLFASAPQPASSPKPSFKRTSLEEGSAEMQIPAAARRVPRSAERPGFLTKAEKTKFSDKRVGMRLARRVMARYVLDYPESSLE